MLFFSTEMPSKVVVDCVYGFPHGDKKSGGDGDKKSCMYGDGDGNVKAVAGMGMEVQYPPG